MGSRSDGNLFYIGEIDEDVERDILLEMTHEIKRQSRQQNGRIDVYVNSPGGYAHLAFHVVELMEIAKRSGVTVRTVVTDMAASGGSIVSVAGTPGERYIAKDAKVLIHYGTAMTVNQTPRQNQRNYGALNTHFKRILKHYQKYCDIPDLEEHIGDDNWWINSKESIKWGIADKYIDKFVL